MLIATKGKESAYAHCFHQDPVFRGTERSRTREYMIILDSKDINLQMSSM